MSGNVRCAHTWGIKQSETPVAVQTWHCSFCHRGPFVNIYQCKGCGMSVCPSCYARRKPEIAAGQR